MFTSHSKITGVDREALLRLIEQAETLQVRLLGRGGPTDDKRIMQRAKARYHRRINHMLR